MIHTAFSCCLPLGAYRIETQNIFKTGGGKSYYVKSASLHTLSTKLGRELQDQGLLLHFQLFRINNTKWKPSWTNFVDSWCPQVMKCEVQACHPRSHTVYLFISLFAGSLTEQDKTQQIVTHVETAHASFTGEFFLLQVCHNCCIKCCFLHDYSVMRVWHSAAFLLWISSDLTNDNYNKK